MGLDSGCGSPNGRFTRHIKAAIWATETANSVRHTVKVSRIYVGTDNEWKTADNFGRGDLLLLAKLTRARK